MRAGQILGVGIGAALNAARSWRKQPLIRADSLQGHLIDIDRTVDDTGVWVELDVEPLFSSSERVSQEYLRDLADSDEDRQN